MTKIKAKIGDDFLRKSTRLFDGSPEIILAELLQNSRRAGAKSVKFDLVDAEDGGTFLTLTDDGHGIALEDFQKLLTLSESKWEEQVMEGEEPAGMGVFCLAGKGCTIRSGDHVVKLTPEIFAGSDEGDVLVGREHVNGTSVSFSLDVHPDQVDLTCRQAVRHMTSFEQAEIARNTGVYKPVYLGPITTAPFYLDDLKVKVHCMNTYYPNSNVFDKLQGVMISFVGSLPVRCNMKDLPHQKHFRDACVIEVLPGSPLKLIHPARQEFVKDAAYEKLLEHLDYVRLKDGVLHGPTPKFSVWEELKSTYPDLPEPTVNENYREATHTFGPDQHTAIKNLEESLNDQCPAYRGTNIVLAAPDNDFEGYSWYDRLGSAAIYLIDHAGGAHNLCAVIDDMEVLGLTDPEIRICASGHPEIVEPFNFMFYGAKGWFNSDEFVFAYNNKAEVNTLATEAEEFFEAEDDYKRELEDFQEAADNFFAEHTGVSLEARLWTVLQRRIGYSFHEVSGIRGKKFSVSFDIESGRVEEINLKANETNTTEPE